MKVIVYLDKPEDLTEAAACLKWALSEPDLNSAGVLHYSNKTSFFEKLPSKTVVIRIQQAKEQS